MFFFLTIENKNKNKTLSINAELTRIQGTTEAPFFLALATNLKHLADYSPSQVVLCCSRDLRLALLLLLSAVLAGRIPGRALKGKRGTMGLRKIPYVQLNDERRKGVLRVK